MHCFVHFSLAVFTCVLLSCVQINRTFVLNDPPPDHALRVASFNIRRFGKTVMSRNDTVSIIVRILHRYDLVFVQETRDASLESVDKLLDALGVAEWNYKASIPVGRGTYKEQYVFYYRPSVVRLLDAHLYNDTTDIFEREPYIAQFQYWSPAAGSEVKVTFVGAHLTPDDVVKEMEALTGVISSAQRDFPDSGGVITMGDFNADCNYMNGAERRAATLLNTPAQYTSFLSDSSDSTVSHKQDCAYDRVIFVPQAASGKVKVVNVKVYDFEQDLGLNYTEAYAVSDHYPVELTLD